MTVAKIVVPVVTARHVQKKTANATEKQLVTITAPVELSQKAIANQKNAKKVAK